jgi:hypothetical protein
MYKLINLIIDKNTMKRIYLIVLDLTAFPLILGSYLILITGYCLTKSNIIKQLTFGLLDIQTCNILHLEELQIIIAILAILHSIAGINVMLERIIKSKSLLQIMETIILVTGVIILTQIILIFIL